MSELLLPAEPEIIPPSKPLLAVSACPHPFEQRRIDYAVPAGLTIAEIIELIQPDPLLRAHGRVFIGEHLILRENWHRVRPAPGVQLTIRLLPSGGGGLRIGLMIGIAVLAIAAMVAAPYLAPVLVAGATTTGGLGVALGAGAAALVSIGGTLLLNHFLPPPVPEVSKNQGNDPQTYLVQGARNRSDIWGKVPFVCGWARVVPPYAALPYREVIGTDVYWRAIFALGHGPLAVGQQRIGETNIENFQEVEAELRRGYWSLTDKGGWNSASFPTNPAFADTWTMTATRTIDGATYNAGQTITFNNLAVATSRYAWDVDQGKAFALYPDDVHEDVLAIEVTYAGGAQIRSTQNNANEISVEIAFNALTHIENFPAGKRKDLSVTLKIEQRAYGGSVWSTVAQPTITGRQQTPLYWGHRWYASTYGAGDANGRYDIRVTRLTPDFDEERNYGKFNWNILRTITTGSPVPASGVAMIALRIRGTGQLQGTIDEYSVEVQTMARDWNGSAWVWRQTSSPAALIRHMLQHPARRKPATDAQIDLTRLAYWDGVTRPANRVFNGVFDSKTSLYDALMRVARLGRAVMTLRDLKYSVVIDEPKTVPVRMFSPRNSWGYEGEMSVEPTPHGYRLSYVNAAENSRTDELVVYDDGYGFANATLIDKVEILGINNYTQAFKEGRYHIAQQRLRREVHRINTDFEHLACERGDLVALQHDVIAVGLANGRIVARTENATHVFDVTLDNALTMEAGKLYGIRARRIYGGAMRTDLYRVNTIVGEGPRLYFASPPVLNDAPAVGDLVSFGIYDRETLRVLVRDIEPQQDLTARLTLIAEAAGVHLAESGPIPAYDPVVTAPLALPAPQVLDIKSDERAMIVTPSRELIDRVLFSLVPISIGGASLYVLYRISATNAGWQVATIQEETTASVAIVGLQSGETYDFQLQYTHPNYLSSPATTITSHYVAGRTTAPAVLRNLSLAIVGGQALLMWALPPEIDVQYGGWVMFRHSPDMDATLWPNTTSLAQAVVGEQTHVYMPLKPGTYFARTYDADGRASTDFAYVSTKQASLLAFSPVGEIIEDPLFTGIPYSWNCQLVSDYITLTADTFDNVADTALLAFWGVVTGGAAEAGQYVFAVGMDLGSVKRCRVTSHVNVEAINESDYWDAKIGPIDSWPDVDGTLGAVVDAHVWGKVSDLSHAAVGDWWAAAIPYQRIDAMEINARSLGALHLRMISEDPAYNVRVTELRLKAEEVA